MRSMFAAVSCACVLKDDLPQQQQPTQQQSTQQQQQRRDIDDDASLEVFLDPTEAQEAAAKAVLTFAFESTGKKLVASYFSGQSRAGGGGSGGGGGGGVALEGGGVLSDKKLQECLSLCSQAADEIFQFYRDCVKQKMGIDSPVVAKSNLVTLTQQGAAPATVVSS